MRRAQVERELRERLSAHRSLRGLLDVPLSPVQVLSLVDDLLPWLMELVEQVEGETREECGKLP